MQHHVCSTDFQHAMKHMSLPVPYTSSRDKSPLKCMQTKHVKLHSITAPPDTHTHTHTHPSNSPLYGTTRYQKGKTNRSLSRESEWQWHQVGHVQVYTWLQRDNHASTRPLSFLQAGCPSCDPTTASKHRRAMLQSACRTSLATKGGLQIPCT